MASESAHDVAASVPGPLRSIAPDARASEHAVSALRDMLARAEAGDILSVVVVTELRDGWQVIASPSSDRARRIGLLSMALHDVLAGVGG